MMKSSRVVLIFTCNLKHPLIVTIRMRQIMCNDICYSVDCGLVYTMKKGKSGLYVYKYMRYNVMQSIDVCESICCPFYMIGGGGGREVGGGNCGGRTSGNRDGRRLAAEECVDDDEGDEGIFG